MASGPTSNDQAWRALRSTLAGVTGVVVRVGVIGSQANTLHNGSELTNAQIAAVHEFGAQITDGSTVIEIPARPFIRSTFSFRRDELIKIQAAAAKAIVTGKMAPEQALGLVGAWAAGAVREQITKYGAFLFQPLALRTAQRKGHTLPLIDTSQLVNSVSFVVLRA